MISGYAYNFRYCVFHFFSLSLLPLFIYLSHCHETLNLNYCNRLGMPCIHVSRHVSVCTLHVTEASCCCYMLKTEWQAVNDYKIPDT